MNVFFAKNKIGFVDGTLPMPAENSVALTNWRRYNAMLRGWLVSSREKEIKNIVKYIDTARDIWLDLKKRFGKENAPRAYEIRWMMTTVRQKGMTVSAYYTKVEVFGTEFSPSVKFPLVIAKDVNAISTKRWLI